MARGSYTWFPEGRFRDARKHIVRQGIEICRYVDRSWAIASACPNSWFFFSFDSMYVMQVANQYARGTANFPPRTSLAEMYGYFSHHLESEQSWFKTDLKPIKIRPFVGNGHDTIPKSLTGFDNCTRQ